jgi:hypothetical protein
MAGLVSTGDIYFQELNTATVHMQTGVIGNIFLIPPADNKPLQPALPVVRQRENCPPTLRRPALLAVATWPRKSDPLTGFVGEPGVFLGGKVFTNLFCDRWP